MQSVLEAAEKPKKTIWSPIHIDRRSLPSLVRETLHDRIILGANASDVFGRRVGQSQGRGFDGKTLDKSADGLYDSANREIALFEQNLCALQSCRPRMRETLLHEIGHHIDHVLGKVLSESLLSSSDAFRTAYQEDLRELKRTKELKSLWTYLRTKQEQGSQNTESDARREAFAALFSEALTGKTNVALLLPKSYEYVKSTIHEIKSYYEKHPQAASSRFRKHLGDVSDFMYFFSLDVEFN